MQTENYKLTLKSIEQYAAYLREEERANNTILKYVHDLNALYRWLDNRPLTKAVLIEWKEHLIDVYAPTSVNSMLAAANSFFKSMGWQEMVVKPLKIQKTLFCDEHREITKEEYIRLVKTARREGNERLSLILQAICATGIRVSELQFITAEAVRMGRTEVNNKGKLRIIFLPDGLCGLLAEYLQREGRNSGPVFVTCNGKPIDRSNIWRDMKKLCESAGVESEKVFPHNLRHLFAKIYYTIEKDLSRLADILGHSSISTTRIYTMESGRNHVRQIGRMELVIT